MMMMSCWIIREDTDREVDNSSDSNEDEFFDDDEIDND